MYYKKVLTTLIILPVAFAVSASSRIYADTTPVFPSCTTQHANVIASYPSGNPHAIVGDPDIHFGSDTVYDLNGDLSQVLQCFCPDQGTNGIQTNWLNTTSLSKEEIDLLKPNWISIQNGSDWGLASATYLAQNTPFSCSAVGGTEVTPSSTPSAQASPSANLSPTPTNNQPLTSNTTPQNITQAIGGSSSTSSPATNMSRALTPVTTQLANTGSFKNILSNLFLFTGLALLSAGLRVYGKFKI